MASNATIYPLNKNTPGLSSLHNKYDEESLPVISFILPFYNPKGKWLSVLLKNIEDISNSFAGRMYIKYIVVNDGSKDNAVHNDIADICHKHSNITYISYDSNIGKGYALRQGICAADSDYVIITDIDFPYCNHSITAVVEQLLKGCDVVIGKRPKEYFRNLPFMRRCISTMLIMMNKHLLKLPECDTQAGLKGFNVKGREMYLSTTTNRFLADTEFILRSYMAKLSIRIVPINQKEKLQFSNFGMSTTFTEFQNFIYLIKLKKRLNQH